MWYLILWKLYKKWCQWIMFKFDFFSMPPFSTDLQYTIRCRIARATKWYIIFFGNQFLAWIFRQNTGKARFSICKTNTVFEVFWFDIKSIEKCLIYHFVEQVKLYRLLYGPISKVQNFKEQKGQKVISQFLAIFTGSLGGVLHWTIISNQQ
jgi:hypothetical protein